MNAKRIALVLVTMVMVSGAAELPDTVEAYRGRYEALKGKLDAQRDAAIGKAVAVYRRELGTLLANVRQQGDLDYVTAIQGELKRLETDPTAPESPAPKRMKHLRRTQWGVKQAEDKAESTYVAAIAKLDADYLTSLEGLEKRLVAANQIEEARQARALRKALTPVPKDRDEEPAVATETVAEAPAKPVVTIRALIDGDTYLNISEAGIQWACRLNVALVGKDGRKSEKPSIVNGRRWRPKWGKPIREHNIRKSEWYPVPGLAGPLEIVVRCEREGWIPVTYTKRMVHITDRQPGAAWYEIEVRHP